MKIDPYIMVDECWEKVDTTEWENIRTWLIKEIREMYRVGKSGYLIGPVYGFSNLLYDSLKLAKTRYKGSK